MKRFRLFLFVIPVLVIIATLAIVSTASTSSEEGKARIWVEFSPGAKGQVQRALNAAGAEFHYEFDDLNSFVVSLPEQALAGLSHNPNILSIEEDVKRYPTAEEIPFGVDMVQARDVWDADWDGVIDAGAPTGAGRTVCIIDSGLYTGHEDFTGVNIIGGYPSNWNTDTCGHGTHVAGTIVAGLNNLGVVGVTPGSTSLYIVKVFGDNCAWTYSSTLTDAANRCSAAGANIISMSLGGAKSSTTEKRAFDSLYAKGVLSIAAAGNEGTSALNYPAGYSSVVSVAAIDENKAVADFSQFNSDVELAAPGVGVKSTVPYIETNTVTVDGVIYTGGHVEYSPYGAASGDLVDGGLCTTTGAWAGKVVLCQRGEIDFFTKVMNVQSGGGVAAVIYNNLPGGFLGTLGEGNSSTIPALSLSQEDGQYLVANKLGRVAETFSEIAWGVNGYELYDGTSMATPHVSAVAALLWSYNPSLTNQNIRDAMTSTAEDLGTAGRDVYYGFGLVQAKSALDSLGGGGGGNGGVLSLTVGTNKASYITRETVTITVTVKDQNGNAVSSASVTVKMTTANGTVVNYSGTTNTSGVATFTHKVSAKTYGIGTYKLDATATKTDYTTANGTITFTVTK
jgi:subtilisin family serine protease